MAINLKTNTIDIFRQYLHSIEGNDISLTDLEIEELITKAELCNSFYYNIGFEVERTKHEHSQREKAFHEQWLHENFPQGGVNFGRGILQDLFMKHRDNKIQNLGFQEESIRITKRERRIVATVIQWLGTNVGWCFLGEALGRCGYQVVSQKEYKELWADRYAFKKYKEDVKKASQGLKLFTEGE